MAAVSRTRVDEAAFYVVGIVGPFDSERDAAETIQARAHDDILAVGVMSGMSILLAALQAGLPIS